MGLVCKATIPNLVEWSKTDATRRERRAELRMKFYESKGSGVLY